MAPEFCPRNVLRKVSNHLLRIFFAQRKVLKEIRWELREETEIEMVYDAWQDLPAPLREEIDRAFQSINAMADQAGVQALIEEGTFHRIDLAAAFERHEGFLDKVMWTFLNHQDIFQVASYFVSADGLPTRYWVKYKGLPNKSPDTSSAATRTLGAELSEFYRTTEGRGHRCTVESYLRAGRQHYFFAYPDDYPDMYIGHDDQGEFVKRPQKPAFEVVFVYDPQAGTLDLFAQGDRSVKARVHYIFCQAILHANPPPEQPGDHPYELNPLLSREFPFPTDPEDGIESVCIRKMRLSVGDGERITLEANPKGEPENIYDLIAHFLNGEALARSRVNVTNVEFQFRFVKRGREQPRPLTFSISFPNSSNLKSRSEERRILAEKYLIRWGIVRV